MCHRKIGGSPTPSRVNAAVSPKAETQERKPLSRASMTAGGLVLTRMTMVQVTTLVMIQVMTLATIQVMTLARCILHNMVMWIYAL